MRLRNRRPGLTGSTRAIKRSLQTDTENLPPFNSAEEDMNPYQLGLDSVDWEGITVCPPTQLAMGNRLHSAVGNIGAGLDNNSDTLVDDAEVPDYSPLWGSGSLPSYPSNGLESSHESDVNVPIDALLQTLHQQAMNVNTEIVSAMYQQLQPDSAPPSVSSPSVNVAFEGTRALLRIINGTLAMTSSTKNHDRTKEVSEGIESTYTDMGGLKMMILACHQHLLSLFRAICLSIEQCLESMAGGRHDSYGNGNSRQGGLFSSAAQLTMILPLLLHLISRIDGVFLSRRPLYRSDSENDIGPISTGEEVNEVASDSTGMINLAQVLLRKIPDSHIGIRRTILKLQARLEKIDTI